jgi:hypothetical protein
MRCIIWAAFGDFVITDAIGIIIANPIGTTIIGLMITIMTIAAVSNRKKAESLQEMEAFRSEIWVS